MTNNKKHPLEWFQEQEMSQVICELPRGGEGKQIDILSKKDAEHYYKMQDRGYVFRKKVITPKVVGPTCESCEG